MAYKRKSTFKLTVNYELQKDNEKNELRSGGIDETISRHCEYFSEGKILIFIINFFRQIISFCFLLETSQKKFINQKKVKLITP